VVNEIGWLNRQAAYDDPHVLATWVKKILRLIAAITRSQTMSVTIRTPDALASEATVAAFARTRATNNSLESVR
jgi:hypothetical protein